MLTAEDVSELASALEPNSSAAVLVFEHSWMKPLRDAIVDSGGVARRQQASAEQPAAQQQSQPPATPQDDLLSQRARLGQMKQASLIDDAEFSAAKAKILGI